MHTAWKNRLQEYCQKQKISLPSYRIQNQSGPPHNQRFKVEVEVNNQSYTSVGDCLSKKEAEQCAAKVAWEDLTARAPEIIPQGEPDPTPSYEQAIDNAVKNHLPEEYTSVEEYIETMVKSNGGHIRKISPPNAYGEYKFEISGSYRDCENVGRPHRKNQIYFIVDPTKRTYWQRCHDPDCSKFKSAVKNIPNEYIICTNTQHECDTTTSTLSNRAIE
ncbi:unnamed protein product [Adineta ricciae]|uniref:DNA-directed primase/polymerase protein n=1 Tax=Adineta ricciae TaxID=249248 RepID=A0A815F2Z6_ADIRI|nr:unnamed protein product [Adineta ricciae]CAF1318143.1 unnamed protein product [Adineta ricciae]